MSDESPDDFLAAHRSRKRLTAVVAIVVAVVVSGAVIGFIATRKPTPKRPPPDAALPPRTADDLDLAYTLHRREIALEHLGKACDATEANIELKELAHEDDWEGIAIIGNSWLARCPADEQVRWKLFKAYEELERWPDAESEATRLIAMNATDVDYWWWRGQARKRTGDLVHSAVDYRQSIALGDIGSSRGINVMGYVDVAPTVGRACEAAFAIRWWGHRNGGNLNDSAASKLRSVAQFGTCTAMIGTGEATIPLADPITLTVGGADQPGTVDLHAPYVVVGASPGLDLAKAESIELVLDGAVVPAKLIRTEVAVGPLRAPDVEVAVVEDLRIPRIGLGFWWRFDWAPSDDGETAAVLPMADPGAL